jgi:hypothetical protein
MKARIAVAGALCAVLSACASVNERIAPRVAQAVSVYCLEAPETRALIRAQVAAMAAPNSIRVDCAADQP